MMTRQEALEFGQFWYVTITPYGKDIEPAVPNKEEVQKSWVDGQMNIFDYLNCREG